LWKRIFLSFEEPQGRWWRTYLEEQLPGILERHKPEAIYVSLPPFSMGPLWHGLAQQYQLPIVFDFRDLWSQWGTSPNPTWFHYRQKVKWEKKCLTLASRVVCATSQVREELLLTHPEIPPAKLVTITNGYDAEITDWSLIPNPCAKSGKYVIGYIGSFYYTPATQEAMMKPWWKKPPHRMLQFSPRREDWLYRSPYFFFRAVAALLARRPELRDRIVIRFAGRKPDWLDAQVAEFGLTGMVESVGHLEHRKCLEFQEQCDCLLITSEKIPGSIGYAISLKTFEYFTARKPILAIVAEGSQQEILAKSGMAVLCDPDASEETAAAIEELVEGRVELLPDATFLATLHRRELTRALADVFHALKEETPASRS